MEDAKFWDFKSYSEKQWFRFLCKLLVMIGCTYMLAHWVINYYSKTYDYEYTKLSKDQEQLINRIFFDTTMVLIPAEGKVVNKPAAVPQKNNAAAIPKANDPAPKPAAGKAGAADTTDTTKKKDAGKGANAGQVKADDPKKKQAASSGDDAGLRKFKAEKAIKYLENEFSGKWNCKQKKTVSEFLVNANSLEAIAFLANTRYQVQSYFWLIGPSVYFEIIFWAFFGVVCSLLFNLGFVGKDSTTDFTNSQSMFDSSEVPFQVAKILYAPICTLVIVLGYNYFSDENIVDISSSKGVIVFAFIGGFYSSRVIALMDRLKDVILPNSGTAELAKKPIAAQPVIDFKIVLKLDPTVPVDAALQAALAAGALNSAKVILQPVNTKVEIQATRVAADPVATYAVQSLVSGIYKASAMVEPVAGAGHYDGELIVSVKPGASATTIMLKKRPE